MFNRNASAGTATGEKEIGLLGPDVEFEGDIIFTGTLRIDGRVKGDISPEKNRPTMLIISKSAVIEGNVYADTVLVSGTVEGKIQAPEILEIYRHGKVHGNVEVGGIMVEVGGTLQGKCQMGMQSANHMVAAEAGLAIENGNLSTDSNHAERAVSRSTKKVTPLSESTKTENLTTV